MSNEMQSTEPVQQIRFVGINAGKARFAVTRIGCSEPGYFLMGYADVIKEIVDINLSHPSANVHDLPQLEDALATLQRQALITRIKSDFVP